MKKVCDDSNVVYVDSTIKLIQRLALPDCHTNIMGVMYGERFVLIFVHGYLN